jgi:hypothetical protein
MERSQILLGQPGISTPSRFRAKPFLYNAYMAGRAGQAADSRLAAMPTTRSESAPEKRHEYRLRQENATMRTSRPSIFHRNIEKNHSKLQNGRRQRFTRKAVCGRARAAPL